MSAKLSKRFLIARSTHTALNYIHLDLLMVALVLAIALFNLVSHRVDVIASLKSVVPALSSQANEAAISDESVTSAGPVLTPPMQAALDHLARRYRVSNQALVPIFAAAQAVGRERRIDPMLLIAVISVESGFNPYSQSVMGAQGLMQIIPRYHQDKVPEGAGDLPFLDPVTNVSIGAQILQESIRRNGGVMAGLQQYAGAADDEEQAYANKVMAEKQRLEQLPRRSTGV